eukprot:jgi/Hompol1/2175/HPOL_001433-RA
MEQLSHESWQLIRLFKSHVAYEDELASATSHSEASSAKGLESQRKLVGATIQSQWSLIRTVAGMIVHIIADRVSFDLREHTGHIEKIMADIGTNVSPYKPHELHIQLFLVRLLGSLKNSVQEYSERVKQSQHHHAAAVPSSSSSSKIVKATSTKDSSGSQPQSDDIAATEAAATTHISSAAPIKNVRAAAKHFEKIEAEIATSASKMKKKPERSPTRKSPASATSAKSGYTSVASPGSVASNTMTSPAISHGTSPLSGEGEPTSATVVIEDDGYTNADDLEQDPSNITSGQPNSGYNTAKV